MGLSVTIINKGVSMGWTSPILNASLKWLLIFLALVALVLISVDQFVCNKWIYHDFAAGIDRRLSCFWKP
jgi:hypothetical protein